MFLAPSESPIIKRRYTQWDSLSFHFFMRPQILPAEYRRILFYAKDTTKTYLLNILFFPVMIILILWFPQIWTKLSRRLVLLPYQADYVLLEKSGKWTEIPITKQTFQNKQIATFIYRKLHHLLMDDRFECVSYNLYDISLTDIHNYSKGISSKEAEQRIQLHGLNSIAFDSIPIYKLILNKALHFFYLFQVASVIIWFNNGYPLYATVISIMSFLSASWEIWSEKKNETSLRKLIHSEHKITVIRNDKKTLIESNQLVVGDAIIIESGMKLVCDLVLVSGQLIINESSVTGESSPIVKTPLPKTKNVLYKLDMFKSHSLLSGSVVTHVKSNHEPIAIVLVTGFNSTKGNLFRAILYPKEIDLKFNRQSFIFLKIMALVALAAFIFKIILGFRNGDSFYVVIFNSLDLITIAVPPALPLVLTMGIGFSLRRLKKHKIYCIESQRVNLAGWIDVVCWDKTGTLTDDKLEFQGIDEIKSIPTHINHENNHSNDITFHGFNTELLYCKNMLRSMAVCHSIHIVDGVSVGPFVDRETFKSTNYNIVPGTHHVKNIELAALVSSPCKNTLYPIFKRYDFDPHIQLASVIYGIKDGCTDYDDYDFRLSVKGSPESILKACKKESLPINYIDKFKRYSGNGYYVIAFAEKKLSHYEISDKNIMNLSRDAVEIDLTFTGFALFRSPIKPESFGAIHLLKNANIQNKIITGDSVLTAINVARQLGMVDRVLLVFKREHSESVYFYEIPNYNDEQKWSVITDEKSIQELPLIMNKCPDGYFSIAVNSDALNLILSEYEDSFTRWFIKSTAIFARAKPNHKTEIIQRLIQMGHYTLMTGDGTNDCGALKAAHVGVALSDSEASIVAPFTSTSKSVADIPKILIEGRCALETSFVAFKYMAVYPVIQLMNSIIAYSAFSQLGDGQYLFDDLFLVFGLATLMLYTKPQNTLKNKRPVKSLFSILILSSLLGQILINISFTIYSVLYLEKQPWFCSTVTAQSGLHKNTFTPLDPNAPYSHIYPCYFIDPKYDVNYNTLITTYESSYPWLFSHFQYIGTAIAFNISTQFRRPIWSNLYFSFWITITFLLNTLFLLFGTNTLLFPLIQSLFQIRDDGDIPFSFRAWLFFIVMLNMVSCVFFERFFVGWIQKVDKKNLEVKAPEMNHLGWKISVPVPCKLKE